MHFANPLLLAGLAVMVIPPAIHFFGRRRYDEVDWGATRFLRLAPKARRTVFLEHWLFMLIRMAALGLIAVSLAGPSVRSSLFTRFGERTPRTTVLLIDVSASMGVKIDGQTAIEKGRRWARDFLDHMRHGDRVAILAVKGDVIPLLADPTHDPDQARAALELLPTPNGSADWPRAIEAAQAVVPGYVGVGEILVLTDGQRYGWADESTLTRWEILSRKTTEAGRRLPALAVVNLTDGRSRSTPNAHITSFTANRTFATSNTDVQFTGMVAETGPTPHLRLAVNGRAAGEVTVGPLNGVEAPFAFMRKLPVGSHVVTVAHDPGNATRHLALDVVPPHTVLVVDDVPRQDGSVRGSDYLCQALSPGNDVSPSFITRTMSVARFSPADLSPDAKGAEHTPRVLVLSDAEKLSPEQSRAVEEFAAGGGGVLVTLGDRANAGEWNRIAHRNGAGWLPARLLDVTEELQNPHAAPKPRTAGVDHPAVSRFNKTLPGGLQAAYFPRHWKLQPDTRPLMSLTNGDALIAEKPVGRGRVVLSAVPLDTEWGSNLVRLPDFVPFVHELCHYLAAGGVTPPNLAPGEPIVFRPRSEHPGPVTVVPPDGVPRLVSVPKWPLHYDATAEPGVYRVTSAGGVVRHFVVQPDPRESDLTPATAQDRARIGSVLERVEFHSNVEELRGRGPKTLDLTTVLLVVVVGLFAAELRCARRTAGAA